MFRAAESNPTVKEYTPVIKKVFDITLIMDFYFDEDHCNLLPKPLFLWSFFVGYVKSSNIQ